MKDILACLINEAALILQVLQHGVPQHPVVQSVTRVKVLTGADLDWDNNLGWEPASVFFFKVYCC